MSVWKSWRRNCEKTRSRKASMYYGKLHMLQYEVHFSSSKCSTYSVFVISWGIFFILKTISSPYRFDFPPSIFCISFHRNLSKIELIEICESHNINCLIENRRETPRRIDNKISNVGLLFQYKTAMTLYSGVFWHLD